MSMTTATVAPSLQAGAALTGGYVVKVSAGKLVPVTATTDVPAGVAARDVAAADITAQDDSVACVMSGPTQGFAGAAIAIGDDLSYNASGALIPKAAAGYVVAKAMQAAAAGQYFAINVNIRKEPA